MPGRFEALETFIEEIAEAEIGHILCLVSDQEIAEKSADYLAEILSLCAFLGVLAAPFSFTSSFPRTRQIRRRYPELREYRRSRFG